MTFDLSKIFDLSKNRCWLGFFVFRTLPEKSIPNIGLRFMDTSVRHEFYQCVIVKNVNHSRTKIFIISQVLSLSDLEPLKLLLGGL